ncbi:MAG: hypothetical protein AAFV54_02415, partial [Pseudomonadota bacterium]
EGLNLIRQVQAGVSEDDPQLLVGAEGMRRVQRVPLFLSTPTDLSDARLEIRNSSGDTVRRIFDGRTIRAGTARFVWDLHHDGAVVFPGMILESPSPATGPVAIPGRYLAVLTSETQDVSAEFEIVSDPRLEGEVSQADLEDQLALAVRARDGAHLANSMVIEIRDIKVELDAICADSDDRRCAVVQGDLSRIEAQLYQVKNESPKDKIAYPIQLNDRLAGLLATFGYSDGPPTLGQTEVLTRLEADLGVLKAEFDDAREQALVFLSEGG